MSMQALSTRWRRQRITKQIKTLNHIVFPGGAFRPALSNPTPFGKHYTSHRVVVLTFKPPTRFGGTTQLVVIVSPSKKPRKYLTHRPLQNHLKSWHFGNSCNSCPLPMLKAVDSQTHYGYTVGLFEMNWTARIACLTC